MIGRSLAAYLDVNFINQVARASMIRASPKEFLPFRLELVLLCQPEKRRIGPRGIPQLDLELDLDLDLVLGQIHLQLHLPWPRIILSPFSQSKAVSLQSSASMPFWGRRWNGIRVSVQGRVLETACHFGCCLQIRPFELA